MVATNPLITEAGACRIGDIAVEVVAELLRARGKHGKQAGTPSGTARDWELSETLQAYPGGEQVASFADLAEWARRRTNVAMADGSLTREMIVTEEFFEALAESDPEKLRAELVQVGAMIVAWIAAIDEAA